MNKISQLEADKLMNVIRFDYDISELGEYLAGDFLLARSRYARARPHRHPARARAARALRRCRWRASSPRRCRSCATPAGSPSAWCSSKSEQRFPGLILARLGAVDVLPIALMDQTRFSLRLTIKASAVCAAGRGLASIRRTPWPAEPRLARARDGDLLRPVTPGRGLASSR